jgi:toxin FitB
MIILDTNVVSELMKSNPEDGVVAWVSDQATAMLYTTAITQAEILHGIALLTVGKRRAAVESAAEAMFSEDFNDRILPFGSDAARAYAVIAHERRKAGRPISQFDAQIAAIAKSNRAVLATRNESDFERCGIRVINPWKK